ncbi:MULTISPECIES: hypothetical protein [Pectobacterium]|uniref:hypothetical protein n=1 Tax=Pectobacterium TaxID=122277 RepID=UPI000CD22548|nr:MULTISPECIES: hypothetical protein [Pectobacterium]MBA0186535.1 hypothetical protein [Pectobacterium odoriferum]MCA6962642.1 hypothetical protein [Pectobacterium odoriferum]MCH5010738.1 hypothetical protein [Pectobacterium odoriferum]POE02833.1 hypothetical protein BV916_14875 [Pectobacterium odoriferum]QRN39517.1 hypothetical protein IHJ55_06475 [Pectobacterium carotovorum]
MLIQKKRIRNIDKYIENFDGRNIYISHPLPDIKKSESIGFTVNQSIGEEVLPQVIGAITRFNANGKSVPDKKAPKETAYRQISWTWKKWAGRDTEEVTETREIEYKRYKRIFTPPPSIELKIVENLQGEKLITSPTLVLQDTKKEQVTHCINLFLEIFGICEIVDDKLNTIIKSNSIKLNWKLLPEGTYPWSTLGPKILSGLKIGGKGNAAVVEGRLELINSKKPDFVAVGKAGFHGYVIFGFTRKNIYILESSQCNNATYIFKNNWPQLSQLTKAEILDANLHYARIIHRRNWPAEIVQYLP